MNWYAAHLVMTIEFKNQPQEQFPFWENIVLIQASTEGEAFAKAEERGHHEEGDDDGSFRWDGKPACWVFAGIRKITLCEEGKRPGDGAEVTYLELQAPSRDAIKKYLDGEGVSLRIQDTFQTSVAR